MSEAETFNGAHAESMLEAANDLATHLTFSLTRERELLIQRNVERLRSTVDEKDKLVEMLAQLERSQTLVIADADLATLDEPSRARIASLHSQLHNTLVRCQETNTINGRLVQRARQSVDEVLATLTGEHRNNTYGASGSNDGAGATRSIGRA